jgi:outer membrane lipoprotein LolB
MPWNDLLTPFWRIAWRLLAVLSLAGCAALPQSPGNPAAARRDAIDDFSLEARFSLRHEDQNYSGRLTWRHSGGDDELLLASPFGQGLAQLVSGRHSAQLTMSDGQVYTAEDGAALTRQVLGYPLPVAQLADWVRGRGAAIESDPRGRPLRLRQDGWNIVYDYDSDDAQASPSRIVAQRDDGAELRLRIDEWVALPLAKDTQ